MSIRFNLKEIKVAVFFPFLRIFEMNVNTRWMALSITQIDDYKESKRKDEGGARERFTRAMLRKDIWSREEKKIQDFYDRRSYSFWILNSAWRYIQERKLKYCT